MRNIFLASLGPKTSDGFRGFYVPIGKSGGCHFKVAICDLKTGRGQHRKYLPYDFTEHGAIMVAMVLNSPRARSTWFLLNFLVYFFVESEIAIIDRTISLDEDRRVNLEFLVAHQFNNVFAR